MYKQGEREYKLKGTYLEVKHWYGIAIKKLAILQTKVLDDADVRLVNQYEKDLAKFRLNLTQIEEACELIEQKAMAEEDAEKQKELLDKIPQIKERRKYDSIKANYEACQLDFENDIKAQNQKELRDMLYSMALFELIEQKDFVMEILRNILEGDTDKLEYDMLFAMAVLNDFFTSVKPNSPQLINTSDSTTSI